MQLKVKADIPLELTAGPQLHKGYASLQLDVFGTFVNVLPCTTEHAPIELQPVANYCTQCDKTVRPLPLSDPEQGWIQYPCHQTECATCYQVDDIHRSCGECQEHCTCTFCPSCGDEEDDPCSNCSNCSSCCDCEECQYCGTKWDSCQMEWAGRCDHCTECGCDCAEEAQRNGWQVKTPGWVERKHDVEYPVDRNVSYEFWNGYGRRCDPVLAMADFYLSDFVSAVIKTRIPQARHGRNNGLRMAYDLLRDSHAVQSHIVNVFDEAFREYGYLAVGGELRHHPAAGENMPGIGREGAWNWWQAMGEKYGRFPMLQDAQTMFDDYGWGSGYGGEAWKVITDILIMRETGKLDARTFVDRCFTLQHNGGSFLDKLRWGKDYLVDQELGYDDHNRFPGWSYAPRFYSVGDCKYIGDAHAADTPDLYTLLRYATAPVRKMVHTLFCDGYLRTKMTTAECASYDYWTECNDGE